MTASAPSETNAPSEGSAASRLIVIEGIDGSGKGTQTRRLRDRLADRGVAVRQIEFPRYEANRFGGLIRRFLDGEFGPLDAVPPELAALLFAGDRFESAGRLAELLGDAGVLLCDRYVASNIAHQGSRLTGERRERLVGFLDWLEHDLYALPRPDLTIYLDVSPAAAGLNVLARAAATGAAVDIAESDSEHLAQSAAVYGQLARQPNWLRIACDNGVEMRPVDEIADDVLAAVEPLLP